MSTFLRELFTWVAGARARAEELGVLRRRLAEQPGACRVTVEEQRLALRLRQLRQELGLRLGSAESCGRCGIATDRRSWPGGHCCSGRTQELFTDPELAALRLGGTSRGTLRAPREPPNGCVFRGRSGCSLEPVDRPCLCASYACSDLEREMARRANAKEIAVIRAEIRGAFGRFERLRQQRICSEQLAELEARLTQRKSPAGRLRAWLPSRRTRG